MDWQEDGKRKNEFDVHPLLSFNQEEQAEEELLDQFYLEVLRLK